MRLVRIQADQIPMVDMLAILRYAPDYDTPWVTGAVKEGRLVAYRIESAAGVVGPEETGGTVILGLDRSGPGALMIVFGLAVHGRRWHGDLLALLRHLASRLGCSAIRGVSPRAGWARWARPVGTIWEINLKEGS
jgi:hypothetical protein